jgi:hydroxysqualene synthase
VSGTAADIATPSGKSAANENFPVGSALIRADLRPHVMAFYRFARMADDIADNPALAPDEKVRRLDLMEQVLLDPARNDVAESVALRKSLAVTGVAATNSRELLVAFRQDATKQRYADWAELMHYCRYSAAPVGRQLLDLHGEGPEARGPADALCIALQVINHLQDCGVDYREMNRIYIPHEQMVAAGIDEHRLAEPESDAGLDLCLSLLLDATEELMKIARHLPSSLRDFRLRAESATIVRLAERMIAQLRLCDPLSQRVKPTKWFFALSAIEGIAWAVLLALRPRRR